MIHMEDWLYDEDDNPRPLFVLINGTLWIGGMLASVLILALLARFIGGLFA